MIEVLALAILALTNLGTLAFLGWYVYLENKNKNKMINSLVAKNSQDFSNFEMADKVEKLKVEPQQDIDDDLKAIGDLTNQEFDKNVLGQVDVDGEE